MGNVSWQEDLGDYPAEVQERIKAEITKEDIIRKYNIPPNVIPDTLVSPPVPLESQTGVPMRKPGNKGARANKYGVAPKEDRTYNGRVYPSKKHSLYAAELDLRVKAGDIDFYLEEVPFRLPGKTDRGQPIKHYVDFVLFKESIRVIPAMKNHYHMVEYVEVKGRDLPMGKLKRRQTEELYHIKIQVV